MKRFTYFLFAMVFAYGATAERLIDEVDVLPIAEKIESVNGKAISVIETGVIVDDNGQQARGVHDVIVSLSGDSAFGVHINKAHILPGGSATFKINLSETKNRLKFPVYPDQSGVEGKAPYTLEIPNVNISVCPEGLTVKSTSCVKYEYAEINYLCPDSHDYASDIGKCRRAELTVASNRCPNGYNRVEDSTTCAKIVSTSPVRICDDDFVLKGSECVKKVRTTPELCDKGFAYDEVNGECSATISKNAPTTCPSGYEVEGGLCVERLVAQSSFVDACGVNEITVEGACHATAEFILGCPDTYKNINNRCVKTQTCGSGYKYDHSTSLCVKGVETIEPYVCPTTHPNLSENDSEKCFATSEGFEKPNSAVNQKDCEEGYVFGEGNRCVTYTDSVTPYCDSDSASWDDDNTVNPETGMCEEPSYLKPLASYLELSEFCPDGFSNNGGVCISNTAKPVTDKCDVGFSELDGSCVKTISESPIFSACPTGAINDAEGNCYQNVREVCPDGQTLMIYEGYHICSPEFEVVNLGVGQNCFSYGLRFDWRGEQKFPSQVINQNDFDPTFEIGTCSNLPYAEPEISRFCERGEEVVTVDGTTFCPSSANIFKAEPICPEGSNLIGEICQGLVVTEIQEKEPICASGFVLNDANQCIKESSVTTGNYCGEVLTSNRECVVKNTSAVGNYCVDGIYEDSTQSCVTETISDSTFVCIDGFELSGKLCQKEEFIEMVVSCPSDYVRTSDGRFCIKSFTVSANAVCPDGWNKQGDVCSYYKSQPIESCPAGYVNKGNGCFETLSAEQVCPIGFTNLGDGSCQKIENRNINSCTAGYTLLDNKCYEVVSANQVCPSGYVNSNDGKCIDFDSQGVTSCPTGYVLENGSCYTLSDANQLCPNGYINNGNGECIDFDSAEITQCQVGYTLFSGQCYQTQAANQTCPIGYSDNGDGTCTDFDSRNISSCPAGYVLNEGNCFSAVDVTETCPDRYESNGNGTCTNFVTTEPRGCDGDLRVIDGVCREQISITTTCPDGYRISLNGSPSASCSKIETTPIERCSRFGREGLLKDGRCYRFNSTIPECPEGRRISSTTCEVTVEEVVLSCPDNYELDNGSCYEIVDAINNCSSNDNGVDDFCINTDVVPVTKSCPKDYVMVGEACTRVLKEEPVLVCPASYTYNGSQCQKTSTYASTKTCTDSTLNPNTNLCEGDGTVEPVSVGCLFGAQAYYNPVDDIYMCTKDLRGVDTPANVTCPDGTSTIEGGNCYVTISEPPAHSCPSGGTYDGNGFCVTTVTTSATEKCSSGFLLKNGICEQVDLKNVTYSCPIGYLKGGENCTKVTSTPVDYTCPDGYALQNTNQCKKIEPTLSVGNCSVGLSLNTSTGKCTGKERTPTVTVCRQADLYSPYNGTQCVSNQDFPEDGVCPRDGGYRRIAGGLCERTIVFDAEKSCPSGYYLYTQGCALTEPDLEKGRCGVGYTLNPINGQCESRRTLSASYSCPEGYVVHDFKFCREESATLGVGQCLSGFMLNTLNNKCERARTATVSYSCSTGYSLFKENQCKEDTADTGIGQCASGFSLNRDNGRCERERTSNVSFACEPDFSLVSGNQCQSNSVVTSVGNCPIGFTLTSNGKCERTLVTQVNYQCPQSFSTYQTSNCLSSNQDRSVGNCPSGYTLNTMGACQKINVEDVELTCDTGFALNNEGECEAVNVDKTIGNCPSQFVLNETTGICEDKRSDSVDLVCEPSPFFTLDGNQCNYYEVNTEVVISNCPEGYTEESNGQCSKVFEYEPIPLCPDEFEPDIANDRCVKTIKAPLLQ